MKQGMTELMARGGYTARGVVYMIVSGFAVLAAFGSGGGTTGTLERFTRNHSVGCYSVSLLWVCSRLERSSLWSRTTVELMRLSQKRLVERFRAVVGLRRRRLEGE